MWEKVYTSSRPTQTLTYYSLRENVQISSFPNNTARKDNPTSHQTVCTSDQAINRKRKASKGQLSPKRINLPKETQQPTNLKQKITHTPSKHPRLENIIDPGDDEQFLKDIEIHENQNQARIEMSELSREPWCEDKQLKQLYKTHMNQIKDLDIQGHRTGLIYIISTTDKATLLTTWKTHERNLLSLKSCF